MTIYTLGVMQWDIDDTLANRKVGINSETANSFEAVRDAIRNQNGEFFITHTESGFSVDSGVADTIFTRGTSSKYDFYTSGANRNVLDLTRQEKSGFVNDVSVYAKGINGEDIVARAVHCTKYRTRISPTYQFDYSLGTTMLSSDTQFTISTGLASNSGWYDGCYVFIGDELMILTGNSYSDGSTVFNVTRGVGGTKITEHSDFAEVLFFGHPSSPPAPVPSIAKDYATGITCNITIGVETVSGWSDAHGNNGLIYVGDEIFEYYGIQGNYFVCTKRAYGKSDCYQHFEGSPVVTADPIIGGGVDIPETTSSIYMYGHRAKSFSLDSLWSRGTADIKAESILQANAFPQEIITLTVADPKGLYTASSSSKFEINESTGNTKNLSIIGTMVTLHDTWSFEVGDPTSRTYRVTKEEFSFDRSSGFSLVLTLNPTTSTNFSTSADIGILGSVISGATSFIDTLKDSISTKSIATSRTSDYNTKKYIQFDGSGGITKINTLLELNDSGLKFTPISTAPPASLGALYFDSSTTPGQLYISNDGTTWAKIGGGGSGNIQGPGTSTDGAIVRWDGIDASKIKDTSWFTIDDDGIILLEKDYVDIIVDHGAETSSIAISNTSMDFETPGTFQVGCKADGVFVFKNGVDWTLGSGSLGGDFNVTSHSQEFWMLQSTDNSHSFSVYSFRIGGVPAFSVKENGSIYMSGNAIFTPLGTTGWASNLVVSPTGLGEGTVSNGQEVLNSVTGLIEYAYGNGSAATNVANLLDDRHLQNIYNQKTFYYNMLLDASGGSMKLRFHNQVGTEGYLFEDSVGTITLVSAAAITKTSGSGYNQTVNVSGGVSNSQTAALKVVPGTNNAYTGFIVTNYASNPVFGVTGDGKVKFYQVSNPNVWMEVNYNGSDCYFNLTSGASGLEFQYNGNRMFKATTTQFILAGSNAVYRNSTITNASATLSTQYVVTDIQGNGNLQYKHRQLQLGGGLCQWSGSNSGWITII